MDNAVSHLRKGCYLELRKIANIRSYLSDAATLKLVLTLVISKLEYCNSLFYKLNLKNIHKLQLIQNHAARLVKKASKRSSAKLLLKDLHWLPVKDRKIYKIAVLVFIIINNNSSPCYIRVYTPQTQRSLRSSQKSLHEVPRKYSKTFGERSFSNAAPEVWNKLPEYIKSSQSTAIFKKNLKTYLFCCSFETMLFLSSAVLTNLLFPIYSFELECYFQFELSYFKKKTTQFLMHQPFMPVIPLFANIL